MSTSMFATVKAKLILLVSILLLLLVAVAVFAMLSMQSIKHELYQVSEEDIPLTKKISAVSEGQLESAVRLERILVSFLAGGHQLGQLEKDFHQSAQRETAELQATQLFLDDLVTAYGNEQTHVAMKGQLEETSQVATAVQEMSATVQQIAASASETEEATKSLLATSNDGSKVVQQAMNAMDNLVADINKTTRNIGKLQDNAVSIGSVLEVIQSIAEQTNLLALNAAIEAARAGDQGRGFAVVADEVRSLAQRTQASTEEIRQMITRIQEGTQSAVGAIEQSKNAADHALELVMESGSCLKLTQEGMVSINDMNTQVATAAEEQAAVVEEISRNVEVINSLSVKTSESSNVAKQAVEQLADSLNLNVQRFRIS